MLRTWHLPLIPVMLALAQCASPGGIYKGYEGPPREATEIAVLEWSTHRNRWVTKIDGKELHEERKPFFGGIATTIAHLLPGPHAITIHNNFVGDFLPVDGVSVVPKVANLTTDFSAGHSYVIRVEPCYECKPFSVDFIIAEQSNGVVVTKTTILSAGTYEEARERQAEECEQRCSTSVRYETCVNERIRTRGTIGQCSNTLDDCRSRCRYGALDFIFELIKAFK